MAPYGRTKAFVDRVRQDTRLGQVFCKSYLSAQTCSFTSDTIFVAYSTQLERIPQRCAWLLEGEFSDIRIVHDRETTERCNRELDSMGITWEAPKPRKKKHS